MEENTYPSNTKIGAALAVDRARLEERLAPMPSTTSITTLGQTLRDQTTYSGGGVPLGAALRTSPGARLVGGLRGRPLAILSLLEMKSGSRLAAGLPGAGVAPTEAEKATRATAVKIVEKRILYCCSVGQEVSENVRDEGDEEERAGNWEGDAARKKRRGADGACFIYKIQRWNGRETRPCTYRVGRDVM